MSRRESRDARRVVAKGRVTVVELAYVEHAASQWRRTPLTRAACSIRVSISAFVRFWRIWRKGRSAKFFTINNWK
jgi:hypothetical protein